ncbi:MAG: cupin domain-containing protein [Acidobacteriota bacterium]
MTGYVGSIEKKTLKNTNFREVLFTGEHSQLVTMCLRPGEDIGSEVHPDSDQFFRVEEGEARFVIAGQEYAVHAGDAVLIPAGTRHDVINASSSLPLKMYTLYSPPGHPAGTVHEKKADALVGAHP